MNVKDVNECMRVCVSCKFCVYLQSCIFAQLPKLKLKHNKS